MHSRGALKGSRATAFACSDISYYLSFPLILVAFIIEESVLYILVFDCEFTKATIALSTCLNSFFSLEVLIFYAKIASLILLSVA